MCNIPKPIIEPLMFKHFDVSTSAYFFFIDSLKYSNIDLMNCFEHNRFSLPDMVHLLHSIS